MQNIRPLTLNPYQLRNEFVYAPIIVDACGRGTGKTTRAARHMKKMDATMTGAVMSLSGRSYANLIDKILPELIKGLQLNGLVPGYDFVFCEKQLPTWFEKPLFERPSYERSLVFQKGTILHLNSLDKNNSNRGSSYDYNYLDEAADVDFEKYLLEIVPANRGNKSVFGKHPLHHGFLLTSSKPTGHKGKFFTDFGNYYIEDGNNYLPILKKIIDLKNKFIDEQDPKLKILIMKDILKERMLIKWYVSKEGVYYNESDAFENWENVGFEYFTQQKKIYKSSPIKFRTEMLNETISEATNGFYPNFNDQLHVYFDSENEDFIATLNLKPGHNIKRDCRWDAETIYGGQLNYDPEQPLEISVDWGDKINFIVVGQRFENILTISNEVWVKKPLILDDVFKELCRYYQYHRCKHINMYYDHTGNSGVANSRLTFSEQGKQILNDHGWSCSLLSGSTAFNPDQKYQDINRVLQEKDPDSVIVRINGNRCTHLINSITFAGCIVTGRGMVKDKSTEKDENFPQEDATHGSDAFDIMVMNNKEAIRSSVFMPTTLLG